MLVLSACHEKALGTKEIQGLQGLIQVTVPSNWYESKTLHKSADIQAGEDQGETYLLVVSELRSAIQSKTMDGYSIYTRQKLSGSLGESKIFGPWYSSVKGRPAVRCEIHGKSDGLNLIYMHEVVETPRYFHQVVAWTRADKFEKNKPEMLKIMESFQEN